MEIKKKYRVIGLMSGTSLDGLDLAFCKLVHKKKGWKFELLESTTIKYTEAWKKKLSTAQTLSGEQLMTLHAEYGKYLGESCARFIQSKKIKKADLIASHGHTIFHQPQSGFTFQLGDGNAIHAVTGLPVAFDFRSLDVQLGGQGAPLVPIGDRYLFHDYDLCLNVGGIANLSMEIKDERKAFDICFVNMGLNHLAVKAKKEFDKDGAIALKGKVNDTLLQKLKKIYTPLKKKRPSLAREGFEQMIQPLLDDKKISLEDRMRTFCESIAIEIEEAIPVSQKSLKILATGGGALNSFFIQLLSEKLKHKGEVIIPDRKTIEFKEALVFALLGVLRARNEINALKSVTGAKHDSSSGILVGF